MKQSLFKIIFLLFCLITGFGWNDPNDWNTEGIELHGRLTKIIENGVEVEIPEGIVTNPDYCLLSLKKDNTFQRIITLNDMKGTYQHDVSSYLAAICLVFHFFALPLLPEFYII